MGSCVAFSKINIEEKLKNFFSFVCRAEYLNRVHRIYFFEKECTFPELTLTEINSEAEKRKNLHLSEKWRRNFSPSFYRCFVALVFSEYKRLLSVYMHVERGKLLFYV
jgi:hypothetical protein